MMTTTTREQTTDGASGASATDPAVAGVRDLVPADLGPVAHRVLDAIRDLAVHSGDRAGWPSWQVLRDPAAPVLRAGDLSAYDGDSGVLWALEKLGPALARPDLLDLAARVRRRVAADPWPGAGGLLDGVAGVNWALGASPSSGLSTARVLLDPARLGGQVDHLSGLAGLTLAALSAGAPSSQVTPLAGALLGTLEPDLVGAAARGPHGGLDRPVCGLSHGQSGVALALAHLLAAAPPAALAEALRQGLRDLLAWESAWFDPWQGWPDLREHDDPVGSADQSALAYPVMWCHGAAGIGMVRLELLRLAGLGVELGNDLTAVQAEAEAAVTICGRHVLAAAASAEAQVEAAMSGTDASTGRAATSLLAPTDAGLTLCHGLAGPLDVLATASSLWEVTEHLDCARYAASAVAGALSDDDPRLWPTGLRTRGGAGLFMGLSGTAMVLARLAWPELGLPAPSLFGVPATDASPTEHPG